MPTAGEEFIVGILGMVITIMLAALVMARRYKKVGPDQAMVVFGRNQYRVVTGGAMFILPIVQSVRYMDISSKRLEFAVGRTQTKHGTAADIVFGAVVKISTESTKLRRASQQWLGKPANEVTAAAQDTLTNGTRSAAAQLGLEEINADPDAFAAKVRELTVADFADLGFELVSLQLKEVRSAGAVYSGALDGRREEVGRRFVERLPALTDSQVERVAAALEDRPEKPRPREVDPPTDGD